jgi:hypothetical protein
MTHRLSRTTVLVAIALLACATLFFVSPGTAHAAPLQLPLPGWLQDMLDQLEIALVKTLQDTARVGGVLLWGVLKVCGLVGLFGNDFRIPMVLSSLIRPRANGSAARDGQSGARPPPPRCHRTPGPAHSDHDWTSL